MGQFSNVLLAIDKIHSTTDDPNRRPGLGGLNQVYGFNCPTQSV